MTLNTPSQNIYEKASKFNYPDTHNKETISPIKPSNNPIVSNKQTNTNQKRNLVSK